ncbi:hypothetical protein MNBD_GAMMA26-321 [hydrothermal vent metagenome]|uniref:Type II secretion system protein GspI C-terminal domain-containing protein n=1 Tax=hydrothermal vent metagenome TaxID=652676 RepID=A0A3B1BC09_9ZZZZ
MRTGSHKAEAGFSLLEVLVALAVLAIAMAALIEATGRSVSNQARLENKTVAHWVAQNQLALLRVADDTPALGGQQGVEKMAGRTWDWQAQLSQTADLDVMRVEVEVRMEDEETVYAHLTGYIEAAN